MFSASPRALWGSVCVALLLILGAIAPVRVSAVTLFDNGPIGTSAPGCSSNNCNGGSQDWTYLDDFLLPIDATITSIQFVDAVQGSIGDYLSTNWSIYTADPFTSAPIASGNAMASSSFLGGIVYSLSISSLDIDLTSGTYWLGTNNQFSNSTLSAAMNVSGVATLPGGALQSDGASLQLSGRPDRAFSVQGIVIPEPSASLLLGIGLLGLAMQGSPRTRRGRADSAVRDRLSPSDCVWSRGRSSGPGCQPSVTRDFVSGRPDDAQRIRAG